MLDFPESGEDFDTLFSMIIEALDVGEYLCTAFDDILDEDSDTVTLDVQGIRNHA